MSFVVQALTFPLEGLAKTFTKNINWRLLGNSSAASQMVAVSCLPGIGQLGFCWPVKTVTICSRFSGTALIKNILSCC